jgi:hypothetical protein
VGANHGEGVLGTIVTHELIPSLPSATFAILPTWLPRVNGPPVGERRGQAESLIRSARQMSRTLNTGSPRRKSSASAR